MTTRTSHIGGVLLAGAIVFGLRWASTLAVTMSPGDEAVLRVQGKGADAVVTDGGNYILDAHCKAIPDPEALADALKRIVGVVEHGLFIGLSRTLVLGKAVGAEVKRL